MNWLWIDVIGWVIWAVIFIIEAARLDTRWGGFLISLFFFSLMSYSVLRDLGAFE